MECFSANLEHKEGKKMNRTSLCVITATKGGGVELISRDHLDVVAVGEGDFAALSQ